MQSAYETLITPYRRIVDKMMLETAGTDWDVLRLFLSSTYAGLQRGQAKFPDTIHPEAALSHIIAALIDRMDVPEVEDRLQAGIYAASAKKEHRDLATEFFDANPDEFRAIQDEMIAANEGERQLH